MLYARKGEVVTCEKGHRIGIFNEDVTTEMTASPNSIDWEITNPPKSGDTANQQCQCGAPYVRIVGWHAIVVHIGDSWRRVTDSAGR